MSVLARASIPTWTNRRRRAQELRERHPHAGQLLGLYLALLPVQERAAGLEPPEDLLGWAVGVLLPEVVGVTVAAGPPRLAAAVAKPREEVAVLAAWLGGEEQGPVDRYLARATLGPVLEARPELAALCSSTSSGDGGCPWCGAPPQLSWTMPSGDPLVAPPRRLACSRCQRSWTAARSRCPACGETAAARLRVFGEEAPSGVLNEGAPEAGAQPSQPTQPTQPAQPVLPHVRVEACESCRGYLLNVDLGRDPRAVPEVDELAALPLGLYADERGYRKVTPNLMGF